MYISESFTEFFPDVYIGTVEPDIMFHSVTISVQKRKIKLQSSLKQKRKIIFPSFCASESNSVQFIEHPTFANILLDSVQETLNSMTDETFNTFVESLAVSKLEKPKRIGEEAGRFWGEIISKQYHFRRGKHHNTIYIYIFTIRIKH